jgi:hypothetical protein
MPLERRFKPVDWELGVDDCGYEEKYWSKRCNFWLIRLPDEEDAYTFDMKVATWCRLPMQNFPVRGYDITRKLQWEGPRKWLTIKCQTLKEAHGKLLFGPDLPRQDQNTSSKRESALTGHLHWHGKLTLMQCRRSGWQLGPTQVVLPFSGVVNLREIGLGE